MSDMSLQQALKTRRSVRAFSKRRVDLSVVQSLVDIALCPTNEDGKRAAPSAHALYPLSLRLSAGLIDGLPPGLYDCTTDTGLASLSPTDPRPALRNAAVDDQPWIETCAFVLTICGDAIAAMTHFADQAPFGQRGERYMYLEAGALAQSMLLHATANNLGAVLVAGFNDDATASVLGLSAPLVPITHLCFGHEN